MASNFRIQVVNEDELKELVSLINPIFMMYDVEQLLGNIDTPEAIETSTKRHERAYREHMVETGRQSAIKCVHTDPASGEETLVACCKWYIFDQPRSAENARKTNYLISAEWVADNDTREKIVKAFAPVRAARIKWTIGRGHAYLQHMCTREDWRRKGAAKMCIQWGLDECKRAGVPAYLEASEEGAATYEKLGYEKMDEIIVETEAEKVTLPVMMWWPPGTKDVDKRPISS